MLRTRFAFSTGCFYQSDVLGCLEPIRAAGFEHVELSAHPAHLDCANSLAVSAVRRRMNALGLSAHSMHAPFGDVDITSPDRDRRERSVASVVTAAEASAELGVRYLVVHPGPEQGDFEPVERALRYDRAVASIDRIIERSTRLGVSVVLENMLPHLFAGRARDLMWLAGSLRDLDVGFCLDTGHAYLAQELAEMPQRLGRRVRMSHVHDNFGERDDHRAPGEGTIDWTAYVRSLAAIEFDGMLVLELGHYRTAVEATEAAARSRSAIERIAEDLATTRA